MHEPKFQYGPIARGIYLALICVTILVMVIDYRWLPAYIVFLLFLGLGLRPTIERTGLYDLFQSIFAHLGQKNDQAWLDRRRKEIDQQERQKKLKKSRYRDPTQLPKNW